MSTAIGSMDELLARLKRDTKIEVLDELIRHLQMLRASASQPEGPSLAGMNLLDAAKAIIKEQGPRGTREIAQMMLARGIRTNSKNFVATIYTTLKNAKDDFTRLPNGTWELKATRKK